MRPRRSTSHISATTRPAPELASMPRCVWCQSDATPSLALYWHIGETAIRLASSRPASRMGENNTLVMQLSLNLHFRDTRASGGVAIDHRRFQLRRWNLRRRKKASMLLQDSRPAVANLGDLAG